MMNKTVILIQLIISSSLPNPLDEIIISKDVVDFKITDPETILKIDEGKLVLLNIDDMIPGSEVNQKNKIYTGLRRWKEFEEQEATTIFTTTTTNFEIDVPSVPSSGDDLEDATDSPIEFNFSKNAEEDFVPIIPNDEYNAEWDLFDDKISTRRMMNNFEELSEEIKETTFLSPSVPEVNNRVSGVEEKQTNETDDYLENTQNQHILNRIAQQTLEIKKEKENKKKHLESIQYYNVKEDNERRASKINKEEKQHVERMRVSNGDHGRKFDNKYGIQRVPFTLEIQRYNNPSIPINTINSDNFNNHKINRISPVAKIQDFEDYSLYKPAMLSQKSMLTNTILKLAEATENSHKFAAGNEYFKIKKPFTSFHNNVNKNKYVP